MNKDYWGTILKYMGIFGLFFLFIWLVSGCAFLPKAQVTAEDIAGLHNEIPFSARDIAISGLGTLILAIFAVWRLTRGK